MKERKRSFVPLNKAQAAAAKAKSVYVNQCRDEATRRGYTPDQIEAACAECSEAWDAAHREH